jgi:hypothetical protein
LVSDMLRLQFDATNPKPELVSALDLWHLLPSSCRHLAPSRKVDRFALNITRAPYAFGGKERRARPSTYGRRIGLTVKHVGMPLNVRPRIAKVHRRCRDRLQEKNQSLVGAQRSLAWYAVSALSAAFHATKASSASPSSRAEGPSTELAYLNAFATPSAKWWRSVVAAALTRIARCSSWTVINLSHRAERAICGIRDTAHWSQRPPAAKGSQSGLLRIRYYAWDRTAPNPSGGVEDLSASSGPTWQRRAPPPKKEGPARWPGLGSLQPRKSCAAAPHLSGEAPRSRCDQAETAFQPS